MKYKIINISKKPKRRVALNSRNWLPLRKPHAQNLCFYTLDVYCHTAPNISKTQYCTTNRKKPPIVPTVAANGYVHGLGKFGLRKAPYASQQ